MESLKRKTDRGGLIRALERIKNYLVESRKDISPVIRAIQKLQHSEFRITDIIEKLKRETPRKANPETVITSAGHQPRKWDLDEILEEVQHELGLCEIPLIVKRSIEKRHCNKPI